MKPTNGDLYIDAALTDFTIQYKNANLVYRDVFPRVTVEKDTGNYYEFGRQNFRRYPTLWSGKTRANQIEWTISKSGSYALANHALEAQISWEDRDNADSQVEYDITSTQIVIDSLDLDEEISTAEAVTTTSNFGTGHYAASPGTSWADPLSRPDLDVRDWKEVVRKAIAVPPNKMFVSAGVHAMLSTHPALLKYLRVTDGILNAEQLRMIFNVEKYIVAGSVYLSSEEGATDALADIWGNSVVLLYTPNAPALKQMSFGYSIEKKGMPIVERWTEQAIHCDWVRPIRKFQKKVTCAYAGFLCVAAF